LYTKTFKVVVPALLVAWATIITFAVIYQLTQQQKNSKEASIQEIAILLEKHPGLIEYFKATNCK
jgi:heme/copper-type cytochrome/quinol oxidase subunit 2